MRCGLCAGAPEPLEVPPPPSSVEAPGRLWRFGLGNGDTRNSLQKGGLAGSYSTKNDMTDHFVGTEMAEIHSLPTTMHGTNIVCTVKIEVQILVRTGQRDKYSQRGPKN